MKVSIISVLGLVSTVMACAMPENIHKRQAAATEFSYQGATNPRKWASLNTAWSKCANDQTQSPIVIQSDAVPTAIRANIQIRIATQQTEVLVNSGHDLRVEYSAGQGNLTRTGQNKVFVLQNYHFHTPSEHRFNSVHYPQEMHIVFQASDGEYTVVGVPVEMATGSQGNNALIAATFQNVASAANPGDEAATGTINFGPLITQILGNDLYAYTGSLTTPPCTEGVNWLFSSRTITITPATYLAVKNVMKFNSRTAYNVYSSSVNAPKVA